MFFIMAEENLTNATRKGVAWTAIENIASNGLSFLFGIILARLLSPSDYGILALPSIFFAVAQCFINCGFASALIRKPDLNDSDLSTAFYFNILVGTFFYGLLFFASSWIASFYNTPALKDVLKVTALVLLFTPLCAVQSALLSRELNFRRMAIISILSNLVCGIVGIIMAFYGFGIWALVSQQVSASAVRTIMLWTMSSWKPRTKWSNDSFRYLWNYGSKLLASGLLDNIYNNIYPLVIGKFYTPEALGNYTRAQGFASLPSSNITGVLQKVTFPVLSSIQNEDERLASAYRRILKTSSFIVFPLMIGLSALADPFIRVLIGEQWKDCILLLQIICFNMMWWPVHSINLSLLTVKGRSDLFLKLEIFKKIIGIIVMLVTIPMGIVAMCFGGIVISIFSLIINTFYTGKLIGVGFFSQIKDLFPILLISTFMYIACIAQTYIWENIYIQLIIGVGVGISVYLLLSYFFMRDNIENAFLLLKKN